VTRLPQHEKVTVQISSKISVPEKTQTTIVTTGAADEEKENTKEQRAAVENVSDDTPKTVVHPTNQRSDPAKDNHNKPVMVMIHCLQLEVSQSKLNWKTLSKTDASVFSRTLSLDTFLGNRSRAFPGIGSHFPFLSKSYSKKSLRS